MRSKVLEVERVQQGGGRGLSRLRSDSACERRVPEGRRGEVTVLVNGAYPRGGARVPRSGGARTPTLVIVCPRDASGFLLVSPRRGSRKKFYCRYVDIARAPGGATRRSRYCGGCSLLTALPGWQRAGPARAPIPLPPPPLVHSHRFDREHIGTKSHTLHAASRAARSQRARGHQQQGMTS